MAGGRQNFNRRGPASWLQVAIMVPIVPGELSQWVIAAA